MAIKLQDLPFDLSDLEPYISQTTLEFHYGKHHKNYVDTLNRLIKNTPYDKMTLKEILLESSQKYGIDKKIYNNAGQAWNHEFYWNCLTSKGLEGPSSDFKKVLEKNFEGFDGFKIKFTEAATGLFGSGWAWLVKTQEDGLSINSLENAGNPLVQSSVPLLTCDVWEHAYYLDYKNERKKYIDNFWNIINWEFVEANFQKDNVKELSGLDRPKFRKGDYIIAPMEPD